MAFAQFDPELEIAGGKVMAGGPFHLADGEEILVMCVRIYQGDVSLAECDIDHDFTASGGRWSMPADILPGRTAHPGQPAVAAASAVSKGPGAGQMNTYQWTQPLRLKPGSAGA